MVRSAVLFFFTFFVITAWAQETGKDVHVGDIYPAIAFFAGVVVAVLGWLLKWFVSRDRESVDEKIITNRKALDTKVCEVETNFQRRIDDMEIAHDKARAIIARAGEVSRDDLRRESREAREELRMQMNGLGLKLEHLADVVDEKVSEAVEELRRHDKELFEKWDRLNREFGQLKGEHDTLKDQHHKSWKKEGP